MRHKAHVEKPTAEVPSALDAKRHGPMFPKRSCRPPSAGWILSARHSAPLNGILRRLVAAGSCKMPETALQPYVVG